MITGALYRLEQNKIVAISLLTLAVLLCIQNLAFYLTFSFNLYLALLALPFVTRIHKQNFSNRYGWLSILFFCLYPFLKIQLCFFLGFAFFIMFVIETFIGKLNLLPVFLLLAISPLSIYFFEISGFSVRLQITEWAAAILNFVLKDVTSEGNMLVVAGEYFSVDRACAGLRMTMTSFLVSIAWLAYYEKRTHKRIHFLLTGSILLLTVPLILVCNLFRIIALVLFNSPPETFSHEMIGMISLVFCVFLPIGFVAYLTFSFCGKEIKLVTKPTEVNRKARLAFIFCLLPLMAYLNVTREEYQKPREDNAIESLSLSGFERESLETGVIKFTNESTLVYVKPALAFYAADHTPLICWSGSGYEFTKENVIVINDTSVYFAELKSKNGKLYTAWWYDNGTHKTTNQLDWRLRSMMGEAPFRVVNVTCSTYEELAKQIFNVMRQNFFNLNQHSIIPSCSLSDASA